jgi:hypothetical protein
VTTVAVLYLVLAVAQAVSLMPVYAELWTGLTERHKINEMAADGGWRELQRDETGELAIPVVTGSSKLFERQAEFGEVYATIVQPFPGWDRPWDRLRMHGWQIGKRVSVASDEDDGGNAPACMIADVSRPTGEFGIVLWGRLKRDGNWVPPATGRRAAIEDLRARFEANPLFGGDSTAEEMAELVRTTDAGIEIVAVRFEPFSEEQRAEVVEELVVGSW